MRIHRSSLPVIARVTAAAIAIAIVIVIPLGPGAELAHADTLVVLNKSDATATLIQVETGKPVATLPTGAGPHEVAISPDGRTAVVADYGGREPGSSLTIIDIPSARVTGTIDLGEYRRPHGIAYLRDGTCVAVTVEGNRALLLVHVPDRKILASIETQAEVSHMVALSRDHRRAFVTSIGSGTMTVLDLVKRERVASIETGAGAEGVAVSPDGREVWVSNRAADSVSIIDTETLEIVATLVSATFPIRVAFTPDGARVLVSNAESGDVSVFDARKRTLVRKIPMGSKHAPIGILIEPSGERAYVANTGADMITILDLGQLEVAGTLRAGKTPDGMGYSAVDSEPAR